MVRPMMLVRMAFVAVPLLAGCAAPEPVIEAAPAAPPAPAELAGAQDWQRLADAVVAEIAAALPADTALVQVRAPAAATPFGRAFRDMLMTGLANAGQSVTAGPADLVLAFEAQVVRGPEGAGEAVVTTTLSHQGRIVLRRTDIAAVAATAAAQFEAGAEIETAERVIVLTNGFLGPDMAAGDAAAQDYCAGKGKVERLIGRATLLNGKFARMHYACVTPAR